MPDDFEFLNGNKPKPTPKIVNDFSFIKDVTAKDVLESNTPQGKAYNVNRDEYGGYMDEVRLERGVEMLNKHRAYKQGIGGEFLGFLNQAVVGEIGGGIVSAFGALAEIPSMIYNQMNGETQDFNNSITSFGQAIMDWTKKATPIYRANEGKAWDVTDSAWWFSNGVSVASTLSMLVPAGAVLRGVSYLGKGMNALAKSMKVVENANKYQRIMRLANQATSAERRAKLIASANELGGVNAGIIADTVLNASTRMSPVMKQFAKAATGAMVMRHAENTREAFGVTNEVLEKAKKEFADDDKYNKVMESEVGKNFLAMAAKTGQEVNKENLAKYIAGQAGFHTYTINYANIVWDMVQMGAILKPTALTRGVGSRSRAIQNAIKPDDSRVTQFFRTVNPYALALGRQLTEGFEEAVNFIGEKEGKVKAEELLGRSSNKTIGQRIADYVNDPHLSEVAFWGTLGGSVFEGIGGITGRESEKQMVSNTLAQISNRQATLTKLTQGRAAVLASLEKGEINKKQAERQINNLEAAATSQMAFEAAASGSVDVLLDQIESASMRQTIEASLTPEEVKEHGKDVVDKQIAKLRKNILTVERLYKKAYNEHITKDVDGKTKMMLIGNQVSYEYETAMNNEHMGNIKSEINEKIQDDKVLRESTSPFVNSILELDAVNELIAQQEAFLKLHGVFGDLLLQDDPNGAKKVETSKKILKSAETRKKVIEARIKNEDGSLPNITGYDKSITALFREHIEYEFANDYYETQIARLKTEKFAKNAEKVVKAQEVKQEENVKEKERKTFETGIDTIVKNHGNSYDAAIAELEKEFKRQTNVDYQKYITRQINILKGKKKLVTDTTDSTVVEGGIEEAADATDTSVTNIPPVDNTAPIVQPEDLLNDANDDVVDEEAIIAELGAPDKKRLFEQINKYLGDKNNSIADKLAKLETYFKGIKLKGKTAALAYIKGKYLALARNSAKTSITDVLFTGETYSKQGVLYTVKDVFTNHLGQNIVTVTVTTTSGNKVIAYNLEAFKAMIASGELQKGLPAENLSTATRKVEEIGTFFQEQVDGTKLAKDSEVDLTTGTVSSKPKTIETFISELESTFGITISPAIRSFINTLASTGITIVIRSKPSDSRVDADTKAVFNFENNSIDIHANSLAGIDADIFVNNILAHELVHALIYTKFPMWDIAAKGQPAIHHAYIKALANSELINVLVLAESSLSDRSKNILNIIKANPEEVFTYLLTDTQFFNEVRGYAVPQFHEFVKTHFEGVLNTNPLKELLAIQENGGVPTKVQAPVAPAILIADDANSIIKNYNLDLTKIKGTGVNGTITKRDVFAYMTKNKINLPIAYEFIRDNSPEGNLAPIANGANLFLPAINLGIKDGVVDANHYKQQMKMLYNMEVNISQEELEETVRTILSSEVNGGTNGSKLEVVINEHGQLELHAKNGIMVGLINSPKGLQEKLSLCELVYKANIPELYALLQSNNNKANKDIIQRRIAELEGNTTHKPFSTLIQMYRQQLAAATAIRSQVKEAIEANPSAKLYVNVTAKTSGNILLSDTQRNLRDVYPNINNLYYVIHGTSGLTATTLVNSADPKNANNRFQRNPDAGAFWNHDNAYTPGAHYILIAGANSTDELNTHIPVKLHRAGIGETFASEVFDNIKAIVDKIHELKDAKSDSKTILNNEEINALKDKLKEFVNVTAVTDDTTVDYFKIHTDYIRFNFGDGFVATIHLKSAKEKGNKFNLVITDADGNTIQLKNKLGNEVATLDGVNNPDQIKAILIRAIAKKQININDKLLADTKPYRNEKSYFDWVINNNFLTTDVDTIKGKNGKPLLDKLGNPVPMVTSKTTGKIKNSNLVIQVSDEVEIAGTIKKVEVKPTTESKTETTPETQIQPESSTVLKELADKLIKDKKIVVNTKALVDEVVNSDELIDGLTADEIVTYKEVNGNWEITITNKKNTGISRPKLANTSEVAAKGTINIEEAQSWWTKVFGNHIPLDTNIVGLINVGGEQAWGLFENAMVSLSRMAAKGTEYHEAFHVVFHLYLNETERNAILDEAKAKYGNIGDVALEELLADEFMDYVLKKGETNRLNSSKNTKGFFSRLFALIRSIFGVSGFKTVKGIENLFNQIESGKFNFAPSKRMVEYAKDIKRLKKVEGYSRQEDSEIVSLLAKMYIEFADANSNLTAGQIKERAELNPRTAIEQELRSLVKSVPKAFRPNINRVADDLDKFYDNMVEFVNRQFGIETDDILDTMANKELDKKWDDTAIFGTSQKDTINNLIKKIIMLTPKAVEVNGNIVSDRANFLGLQTYLDFNKVYPYIQGKMVGATSIEEMLARLENMTNHDPSLFSLYGKLSTDKNLQAAWFSSFYKQTPEKLLIQTSSTEEGRVIKADQSNKNIGHYLISNEWKSNFIAKLNTNVFSDIDTLMAIEDEINLAARYKYKFQENLDKLIDTSVNLLNTFGVSITKSQLTKILNNPVYLKKFGGIKDMYVKFIETTINGVYSEILAYNERKNIADKAMLDKAENRFELAEELAQTNFNSLNRFNELARLANLFQYDKIESSHFDVMGNNVYGTINPHFLSIFFDKIKAALDVNTVLYDEAREDLLIMLYDYIQDPSMVHSNWLWNRNGNDGIVTYRKDGNYTVNDINYNYLESWYYGMLDGVKDTIKGEGQQYGDMSDATWRATQLIMYLETNEAATDKKTSVRIPILIPSDSGNISYISSARIPYGKDCITAVERTVLQEIERMKQARDAMFFKDKDGKYKLKEHKFINDPTFDTTVNMDWTKLQANYHYKKVGKNGLPILINNGKMTGSVFEFHNVTRMNKVTEQFDNSNELYGVSNIYTSDLLNSAAQEKVTTARVKAVREFIVELRNEGKKLYGNTKKKSGAEAIIKDSVGYSKYNNFEEFITEFMVNSYVSNVEQFNFFVGNIAEYKDGRDTNKRAKEIVAPGVVLSRIFTGQTYRSATFAKAEIASKIYDDIVDSLATAFRKNPAMLDFPVKKESLRVQGADTTQFNLLEKAIYAITEDYLSTEIADGQGYTSVKRYENIIKDLGRWNSTWEHLFKQVRLGKELTMNELTIFMQPFKGFYYGRDFDGFSNRMISNQIKYSTVPLIPQLVKGTEAEKLLKYMEENNLDEIIFESAEKVGRTHVIPITDAQGRIIDSVLDRFHVKNGYEHREYYNHNWRLQLDIPDHLMDTTNKMGSQITKLMIANLPADATFKVGNQTYKTKELIQEYFDLISANVEQDANELLNELGAVKKPDGSYSVDIVKVKKILDGEVTRRGISDNYREAIELLPKADGTFEFNLPLFVNSMVNKWESILTSLFTNRVTNQTLDGGSAVLLSSAFITNKLERPTDKPTVIDLDSYDTKTRGNINWTKEKLASGDFTLKMARIDGDKVVAAEAVLPAWSKDFYHQNSKGEWILDDINNIPEELREMIAYRIPSEDKYSVIYLKVVGFLPQSLGSTIILPQEIVTSSGADFDVDKVFLAYHTFRKIEDRAGRNRYFKYNFAGSKEERRAAWLESHAATKFLEQLIANPTADIKRLGTQIQRFDTRQQNIIAQGELLKAANTKELNEIVKSWSDFLGTMFTSLETIQDHLYNLKSQGYNRLNEIQEAYEEGQRINIYFTSDVDGALQQEQKDIKSDIAQVNILLQQVRESIANNTENKQLIADSMSDADIYAAHRNMYGLQYEVEKLKELEAEFERIDASKDPIKGQTRKTRNNRLIDIWKAIMQNPDIYSQYMTPQSFSEAADVIAEVKEALGLGKETTNPNLPQSQLGFRQANIAGRALKALSANSNAFLNIAQVVRMQLRNDLSFVVKYRITINPISKENFPSSINESNRTNIKNYINHSGGAKGGDATWDSVGKSKGFTNHNHYTVDYYSKLSDKERIELDKQYLAAVKFLNRGTISETTYAGKLVRRDMIQANNGDAIFGITELVKPGITGRKGYVNKAKYSIPEGGTGYAVARSILLDKPTYVFNQSNAYGNEIGWYIWNKSKNDFVKTDTPVLTPNFTGIGSQEINDIGKKAIAEVYDKTLEAINTGVFPQTEKQLDIFASTTAKPKESIQEYNSRMEIEGKLTRLIKLYDVSELETKYGKDNVKVSESGEFAYINHNRFAWNADDTFTNVDGKTTTVHASQMLAMILDIVKEGMIDNVNTYTFTPFVTMLNTGIGVRYAGMFIRQPILVDLSERFFEGQSIFGEKDSKEIEDTKRKWQTELFKAKYYRGDYAQRTSYKTKDKIKKISTFVEKVITKDSLIELSAAETEAVLDYTIDTNFALDVEELKSNIKNETAYRNNTMKPDERVEYITNQLRLIEMYKLYKKSGQAYEDIMQALKADKAGTGPHLSVTDIMKQNIEKATYYPKFDGTLEGARILIDGKPATVAVLPSYFGSNDKSVYSMMDSYWQFANELSSNVLDHLFLHTAPAIKRIVESTLLFTGKSYTEENIATITNYIKGYLSSDLPFFDKFNTDLLLGRPNGTEPAKTQLSFNEGDKTISLEDFNELSAANKLYLIKLRDKELLERDTHILNYLVPRMDNGSIKRKGIHSIEFINTKTDSLTDDRLVDSMLEMWESSDPYLKSLAEDLIAYNFQTTAFAMKKDSFSKLIPTQVFVAIGLREHLNTKNLLAQDPKFFSTQEQNIIDRFIRSNWYDSSVVPRIMDSAESVKNKAEIDDINRRLNSPNVQGQTRADLELALHSMFEATMPVLTPNLGGVIKLSKKSMYNLPEATVNAITRSPYVLLPKFEYRTVKGAKTITETGSTLYKKYEVHNTQTEETTTYLYPVEKLGNRIVNEYDSKTSITENEVLFTQEEYELAINSNRNLIKGFEKSLANPILRSVFNITKSAITDNNAISRVYGANTNKDGVEAGKTYQLNERVWVYTKAKDIRTIMTGNRLSGDFAATYKVISSGGTLVITSESILNDHFQSFVNKNQLAVRKIGEINFYAKTEDILNDNISQLQNLTDEEGDALDNTDGYKPENGDCK